MVMEEVSLSCVSMDLGGQRRARSRFQPARAYAARREPNLSGTTVAWFHAWSPHPDVKCISLCYVQCPLARGESSCLPKPKPRLLFVADAVVSATPLCPPQLTRP